MMVKTINAAIIRTPIEISITPLLLLCHFHAGTRQFVPAPYVRNTVFIPGDDHLHSGWNRRAAFTAGAYSFPRSLLREQDFSCPADADISAHCSQHTDHFEIRRIEVFGAVHKHFRQKHKDDRSAE